jgi:hypothetical protein
LASRPAATRANEASGPSPPTEESSKLAKASAAGSPMNVTRANAAAKMVIETRK